MCICKQINDTSDSLKIIAMFWIEMKQKKIQWLLCTSLINSSVLNRSQVLYIQACLRLGTKCYYNICCKVFIDLNVLKRFFFCNVLSCISPMQLYLWKQLPEFQTNIVALYRRLLSAGAARPMINDKSANLNYCSWTGAFVCSQPASPATSSSDMQVWDRCERWLLNAVKRSRAHHIWTGVFLFVAK